MPVDPTGYDKALADIQKLYNDHVIVDGDTYDNPKRLPFESPQLNFATGGGVPVGRWTRAWGETSSGKTRLMYGILAEAQRQGMTVAYYNIEQQYHIDHVKSVGVDVSKLKVVNTQRIEEVGEIAERLMGSVHVHLFDSCSAGKSIDELNADITDWPRAIKARAWGKAFDRMADRFDDKENTIICIDQARSNQRVPGGIVPWGSQQMEFQSSLTLKFMKGGWLFKQASGELEASSGDQKKGGATQNKSDITGKVEPDGIEVLVRVEKSRVGRPFKTAMMRLDYDGMKLDVPWELTKAAIGLNLIESKAGGNYYIPVEGSDKPLHIRGGDKLKEFIRGDEDLQNDIIDAMFDAG
jgi:RecA/RadA recombinase